MDALFSDYEDARRSGLFDADYYLATYPDVADRNVDPLVHYLEEGAREGRNPHPDFDSAFYYDQCRGKGEQPENPLLHYIRIGAARGFKTRAGDSTQSAGERPAVTTDGLGQAPILVAIESLGVVGAPDGTSRFSVGGWALGTMPIAEISVSLDGAVAGTATYGLPRPDVARLYPNRPGSGHCGFILAFNLPQRKTGAIEPLLSVRLANGETGQRLLRVEIPPQQIGPLILDPLADGPEPPATAAVPMQLFIDEATVDANGILRLGGWVVCIVQIEAVEAFIDGEPLGKAEFGRARDDVEREHGEYPNARFSGFSLSTDIARFGSGTKTIRVRASARTGIERDASAEVDVPKLARSKKTPLDTSFHYHCDDVALTPSGRIALSGWIVSAAPVGTVLVLFDGEEIGRAEFGLERPDVGNLFPSRPHARRPGFAFEGRTAKRLGTEHAITLRARREDGKIDEATIPVVPGEEREVRTLARTDNDPDLKLHIDSPLLVDGAVEAPIRGNLEIGGWALAKAGVAAVEIAIDGKLTAIADYGLRRLDIRAAYPDWENSLACGYQVLLPHRVLPTGIHAVTVTLRDAAGKATSAQFRIEVEEIVDLPGPWALRRKMAQAEIDLSRRIVERRGAPPFFTAVLPLAAGKQTLARAAKTIGSLARQVYPNWRLLVLAEARAGNPQTLRERLLADAELSADRIEILRAAAPANILPAAGNAFVTILGAGDELGCDAFLEMAVATALHPEADFLYSDERCRNPASDAVEAFFKPQWSPDLMLSTNYIGRLWCARAELLGAVAEPTAPLLGRGEYDLVLRCTEAAKAIRHVPKVLCERGAEPTDDPRRAKAALERALARRGINGEIREGLVPASYRVKRKVTKPGLVSIVIPTCAAQGLIETCIKTLRRITTYPEYEIICIENIPAKDRKWRSWLRRNADRVISTTEPFNWARFNNLAIAEANGEYILCLNDDIEILDPDWLDLLVEQAQRPEVGVVGARLLYPDRRIQHAGMFLALVGQGRHAFRYLAEDDPGYFGLALTQRNVIAVTGACLMTRREIFDRLGGFDETQSIINNDMDLCLRAWRQGLLTVYAPQVRLIHREAISRVALADDYDAAVFEGKWQDVFLAGDPYFNPNLSTYHDDFAIDHEPTQLVVAGSPVLRRDEIRKILVLKLDHIGDCIIAFPAVRRLRQHFPGAHIAVLTSRSSRPVWSMEPSVDETIEFDFFHARSGLGEIDRTNEDWRKLQKRLAPYGFDLAIDLRKHIETRPVLQHTGARYLAGFDWRNHFPWLDIALEWTGDQMFARKHQHNGSDLINLVDAVAAACDSERATIALRPPGPPARALLPRSPGSGPLVCVHPAVGNDARQWPPRYFAAVIDRLIEQDDARVVLIGGPGDEEVEAEVLDNVRRSERVSSLIGKLPLAELPALLAQASLFIGNNSGPKHLAAGLGVPTVGIHSGTVDVREWGPIGPNAVAVAREVFCAPCYIGTAADCRRGLVCLNQLEPAKVYDACKRMLLLAEPRPAATHETGNARPRDDGNTLRPPRRSARSAKRLAGAAAPPP